MEKLVYLVVGGSIGTLSRYGLSMMMLQWLGPGFPYGTLAANLSGCFLIGLIAGLPEAHASLPPSVRLLVITGFLGALTTFSAYEYESFLLGREGHWLKMALNLGGSVVLGFFTLWLGYSLMRSVFPLVKGG